MKMKTLSNVCIGTLKGKCPKDTGNKLKVKKNKRKKEKIDVHVSWKIFQLLDDCIKNDAFFKFHSPEFGNSDSFHIDQCVVHLQSGQLSFSATLSPSLSSTLSLAM